MDGEKKTPREIMEESLRGLQACSELYEQAQVELANQLFIRYKALRESGFTEDQAFQIVLTRGLN